jgi:predicted permease
MWNDLKFAIRTSRRAPGFTLVAVASLALGIGANTAIFSLLYQVVLRSVPVRDPETLVALQSDDYNLGWSRKDNSKTVFSYPMYRELRDRGEVFSGLIARASFQATLAYGGEATSATAEVVTGNFFAVLGVRPALGRPLLPFDDSVPGQNPAIVLSYSYWADHLGGDASVLNSVILMNGHPAQVVGVAPRGFRSLLSGQTPDFFIPVSAMPLVSSGWQRNDEPDAYWLSVFGRLKPGVTAQQANARLLPLFRAVLESEIPRMSDVNADARKRLLAKTITVEPASQGVNELRSQWQAPLTVLMVMVGLVLLIACTNIANLLIARAAARQREIAVRLAIGAGAWQLARQLLMESMVVAAAGGIAGLLLSGFLTRGLLDLLPADAAGGWLNARLDGRLLAYSIALAAVTGLLFGVIPAFQAGRTNLVTALKEQSAGAGSSGAQSRMRQALVAAQIAISLLLLVGAGLFTRSMLNLAHTDPGFVPDRLVAFDIDPSLSGYSRERGMSLFRELSAKLRGLPGVTSVTTAEFAPFGGFGWGNGVKVPGSRGASDQYAPCSENSVGPDYFRTFGIPLIAGREFTARDTAGAPKVAIINETFARFLFGAESPLGRHMLSGADNADLEIVGVVKDSKYGNVREKPERFMYIPYEQGGDEFRRRAAFFVRTGGDESAIISAARDVVKRLDRNLPIERLTSMRLLIHNSIYTDRLMATLAIGFGVLATILAAVGLYGTIAYSVARRTREFGIRLALGAAPQALLSCILSETGWLLAAAVGLALPASYALARLAESQLFGIKAHDPLVLAGATILIIFVAVAAAAGPAIRAMRIEPVRALREE